MSVVPNSGNGKITVPDLLQRKSSGAASLSNSQKITCLTAYDYPTARLLDEAGVDVLLVGDSLGMVVLGYESTLPVSIEEMLHHTRRRLGEAGWEFSFSVAWRPSIRRKFLPVRCRLR